MSPISFRFVHDRCTRSIRNGRRVGPTLTVFVDDAYSLGFFMKMVVDGDLERIAILNLWMDRECWMSARWALEEATFPALTHGLFGYRAGRGDGWGASPNMGVWNGATWVVNWNSIANTARHHFGERTEVANHLIAPMFANLAACPRTTFVALGQVDFFMTPFHPPPHLTVLHLRSTDDSSRPIVMRLLDFAMILQSVPSLVELELWRVGFDLAVQPPAINHDHLRRMAVLVSSPSVEPLFAYLKNCQLDTFVLDVHEEGYVHVNQANRAMVSALQLFTNRHTVESVGLQWSGSSGVWTDRRVELYLRSGEEFVASLRIPIDLAHTLSPVLEYCVPVRVPLSIIPSAEHPTADINAIVTHWIPWPQFPHVRLLDTEFTTDRIVTHLMGHTDIRDPVLVILHREPGIQLQWHGGVTFRSELVRVDFLLDPGCCHFSRDERDERLPWTSFHRSEIFTPLLDGPLHHLWRMMDF